MKAPFIFNDNAFHNRSGDLQIFERLDNIYNQIEIQDIEHKDVTIYDSEGWILGLKDLGFPKYELYRLEKKEDQLIAVLLDYLANQKKVAVSKTQVKQNSLSDLIGLAKILT